MKTETGTTRSDFGISFVTVSGTVHYTIRFLLSHIDMKRPKPLTAVSTRVLFVIISVTSLAVGIGCSRRSENMAAADSVMAPAPAQSPSFTGKSNKQAEGLSLQSAVSSSAAVVSKDSTKKFIRTAELRFKVKRAIEATYQIENIIGRHDGYVSSTNLESDIDNKTVTPVSEDSSLTTTYYTLKSIMTLRVPDTQLDTTLKEIAPLIDFLDHRVIKAEDVSLKFLANNVNAGRLDNNANRVTSDIDKHGKKLDDISDAEDKLLTRQQQSDNARISNLILLDQVKYSTIQLSIYQRQEIRRELVPNDKNIESFRPGIGTQLVDALQFGWRIFEMIIVIIVRLWGVILLVVLLIILYKMYRRRQPLATKVVEKEKLP
jgi:hypothetical protein